MPLVFVLSVSEAPEGCGFVFTLASRPPQILGSANSAPEGLGSQYGANLVRDKEYP